MAYSLDYPNLSNGSNLVASRGKIGQAIVFPFLIHIQESQDAPKLWIYIPTCSQIKAHTPIVGYFPQPFWTTYNCTRGAAEGWIRSFQKSSTKFRHAPIIPAVLVSVSMTHELANTSYSGYPIIQQPSCSMWNNLIVSIPNKEWLPDLDSSLRTMNTKQPQAALWWFASMSPSGTRQARYG
jgi:hypothetical protein